jgi:hypothetical protein
MLAVLLKYYGVALPILHRTDARWASFGIPSELGGE